VEDTFGSTVGQDYAAILRRIQDTPRTPAAPAPAAPAPAPAPQASPFAFAPQASPFGFSPAQPTSAAYNAAAAQNAAAYSGMNNYPVNPFPNEGAYGTQTIPGGGGN
jgi:hypothetical protein